jgi:O-antigen/teichoic acid export membrane protein
MIGRLYPRAVKWLNNRDASYLYALIGEATLGLTFVFYALLARILGPEQNGVFTAAVSLGGILAVFIQFGLPALLTRDVAADPAGGSRQTLLFLVIQVINTVPVLLVLPFLLAVLDFTRQGAVVCYLVIIAELLRSVKMLWRSVLRGRGWFSLEALAVGAERLFVVLCSGAVLLATRNLVAVVAVLALARLADNLSLGYFLSRKVAIRARIHREALLSVYRKAYPFALHGLLWVLYYQVDIIMLKAMAPAEEVGYYGAAFRVLEIFAALPRVIFYVAFTRFAASHARNPAELPGVAYRTVRLMLVTVLPVLVIAGYGQSAMIRLIYGTAYLPSVILMAVLLPGLSVKMFSVFSEEYLLATGREKKVIPLMLTAAAGNILINLLLIPRYGALGAALATGITECVYTVLGLSTVVRHGLPRAGRRFLLLVIPCVALVIAPALILAGYSPWLAAGISLPFLLPVALFMRTPGWAAPAGGYRKEEGTTGRV